MNQNLLDAAIKALEHSYSPYSNYQVGAALMTVSGKIYSGCNIENAAYGATICAERVAMFKSVSENPEPICDIVIVTGADEYPSPCGTCRQVMAELAPNAKVHLALKSGEYRTYTVGELLPIALQLKK